MKLSLKNNLKKNYGFSNFLIQKLSKRLEFSKNNIFEDKKEFFFLLTSLLLKKIPENFFLKNTTKLNILILNFINSYKGYRHLKGLPVNGQRTWSNAWSTYRNNHVLRSFKIELAKKFYGNISYADIKVAFLAEQTNLLWKQQWYKLWKQTAVTRNLKSSQKTNKKSSKPDLILMAKGNVFLPSLKKELTKKQKTNFDKSIFACGYRIGFTKILLKDLIKQSNQSNSSVLNNNATSSNLKKKKTKKKGVDEKAKKLKHKLKKQKKKSVWE